MRDGEEGDRELLEQGTATQGVGGMGRRGTGNCCTRCGRDGEEGNRELLHEGWGGGNRVLLREVCEGWGGGEQGTAARGVGGMGRRGTGYCCVRCVRDGEVGNRELLHEVWEGWGGGEQGTAARGVGGMGRRGTGNDCVRCGRDGEEGNSELHTRAYLYGICTLCT